MIDRPFFWRARSAGMGTNHGAINDEVFHISVMDEVLMHSIPDTLHAPADEPLVDTVPSAILRWEQSPLGTGPRDPHDTFDKAAAISFVPHIHIRTAT